MPPVYDSLVGRDDVAALIPEDASRQIIQDLPKASVALSSFRMARMSRHQQRVPVLNFLPTAYWVGSDTGIKQTTEQQWANLYLDARELAVLVPIPEVVLDDSRLRHLGRDPPARWRKRWARRSTPRPSSGPTSPRAGPTPSSSRRSPRATPSPSATRSRAGATTSGSTCQRHDGPRRGRRLRRDRLLVPASAAPEAAQPARRRRAAPVPGGHRRWRLLALWRAHRLGPERLVEQRPCAHRG